MKKNIIVIQKQQGVNGSTCLFEGKAEIEFHDACLYMKYKERKTGAWVAVSACDQTLTIHRKAEAITHLHFLMNQMTWGSIKSAYGIIKLQLYTHKYIKKENRIAVSYDVLHEGVVSDRFSIIWMIKEDVCESD